MRPAIIASSQDLCGVKIVEKLVENHGFYEVSSGVYSNGVVEAYLLKGSVLWADGDVASLEADYFVVASKHVSSSGVRCLLVHSTGNWGESASYGGRPFTLSATSTTLVWRVYHSLKRAVDEMGLTEVEVGFEATHHGPLSEKPLVFVEVGSDINSWRDDSLTSAAAAACIEACRPWAEANAVHAVGFGGGHYARDMVRAVEEEGYAVGHIAAKHHFPLRDEVVRQAFEKTLEKPRTALLDWDGLRSEHRAQLLEKLQTLGVDVVRV